MKHLLKFLDPIGWMYCSDNELEALLKNGWVKSSEKERQEYIETKHRQKDDSPNGVDIEQLREQYAVKFGKTPHHKKSADTLQKELAII